MKRLCMTGLVVLAISLTGVQAKEEAKHDAPAKTEQEANLKEITLTGMVEKVERKKKDGSVMMAWFVLVDESGRQIHLPKGKVDEFVGCKVRVTGMGVETQKKGKDAVSLKSVLSVEKIEIPAK